MDARTIWVADHQTESVAEHAHDYYQLLFCHTSGGVIRAQGVDYPALENHLFLIKPMVPHAFVCSGPLRLIELKFMLGPEDAKSAFRWASGLLYPAGKRRGSLYAYRHCARGLRQKALL